MLLGMLGLIKYISKILTHHFILYDVFSRKWKTVDQTLTLFPLGNTNLKCPLKQNFQVRNSHRVCILCTWEAEAWNWEFKSSQGYIPRVYLLNNCNKKVSSYSYFHELLIAQVHSESC